MCHHPDVEVEQKWLTVFQPREYHGATFYLYVLVKLEQINEALFFSKLCVGLS